MASQRRLRYAGPLPRPPSPCCVFFLPNMFMCVQKEILARIAEGSAWKNTLNSIPIDAAPSSVSPRQRVFKVRSSQPLRVYPFRVLSHELQNPCVCRRAC